MSVMPCLNPPVPSSGWMSRNSKADEIIQAKRTMAWFIVRFLLDCLPKVYSSIGEVRSFFVPNGDNGETEGCIHQRINPGMIIPYPRAPTGRTELCLHQLLCFVDLRAPRWGADHFTLIPGCQLAPFAFTVSPIGAKINEKIFEKRSRFLSKDEGKTKKPGTLWGAGFDLEIVRDDYCGAASSFGFLSP